MIWFLSRPCLFGSVAVLLALSSLPTEGKEPGKAKARPPKPEVVGKAGPNRYIVPTNQVLTPAGVQVDLPKLRPQALALSPDGVVLITAGKTNEVVVVDPATGKVRQKVTLPGKKKVAKTEADKKSDQVAKSDKEKGGS